MTPKPARRYTLVHGRLSQVHWGRALVAFLAAEILLIASAVAWVASYSYAVHPGEPASFYEKYAESASPWVALIAGFPIFYLAARWARTRPNAIAILAVFVMVDVAILLSMPSASPPGWIVLSSYATKLLACHLGCSRPAIF